MCAKSGLPGRRVFRLPCLLARARRDPFQEGFRFLRWLKEECNFGQGSHNLAVIQAEHVCNRLRGPITGVVVTNPAAPRAEQQEQEDEATAHPRLSHVAYHPTVMAGPATLNGAPSTGGFGCEWADRHNGKGLR